MHEAEQRIIFHYFLSLTADRYSIDARKNDFSLFLKKKIVGSKRRRGLQEKNDTLGKQKKRLSKGAIFFFF